MAQVLDNNLSKGAPTRGLVNKKGGGKEPLPDKGAPGSYLGNSYNFERGIVASGPYLINGKGHPISPIGAIHTSPMDGTLTSTVTKDEGRFEIPGPYSTKFGNPKSLEGGNPPVPNGVEIYDPEGFGDDLDDEDDADSGFSDSPDEQSVSNAVPAKPTEVAAPSYAPPPPPPAQAPPAAPNYAPPPPPQAGSYPPLHAVSTPPITVTQTRRRRAQSESTPPSSPPPNGAAFLSPPNHHITAHRRSSPPAPRLDQGQISPVSPVMPRLQQRHTLQVPQALPAGGALRDPASGDEGRNVSPTTGHRRASMNLIRRQSKSLQSETHPNVPQDEDAARRAELMKQKLIARRKRKEEEDEDRVLVGTRVDMNHQNWVTAYNMLTGIRFTVSRTNAKIRDHPLDQADFNARHKYAFDVTGSELTPSAKYDFKFKDYAPQVFKELRSMFGIDPADYLVSLTSKILLSELASPGKSKSFFYFSRDYKYIIKTVHHAEHKLLRKILPRYFEHVKNNPNTLLSQFYGLHRIKSTWGAHKTHFVVMNNLFPPHRDIHQTYDLKGSTVGRELKEEDLEKNPRATLKDLNWMRRDHHLAFGPMIKAQFIQQMERDVELLKELGIMDYSLLVGIHDLSRGNEEGLRDKTLKVYQPGGRSERSEDGGPREANPLHRSPSNAERTRAARELRATLRTEKPVPMNQSGIDMPENNAVDRTSRVFTKDDGGIQAEHDNGAPGNEIYYLGIIDCLTKYGMVKRIEHFVKGLSNNKNAISAVKPDAYGDRFVAFMKGISKTDEEAAAEKAARQEEEARQTHEKRGRHSLSLRSHSQPRLSSSQYAAGTSSLDGTAERRSEQGPRSPTEEMTPSQQAAERKARRSGEDSVAEEHQRTLGTKDTGNVTLPVLEEVNGENSSSTGGRSRERSAVNSPAVGMTRQSSAGSHSKQGQRLSQKASSSDTDSKDLPPPPSHAPPPPPPAPSTAAPEAPVYGGRPPPTPPKDEATPQIGGLPDMGESFSVSPVLREI